jgi:hypothetical protein
MRQRTKFTHWLALAVAAAVVAGMVPHFAFAQEGYRVESVTAAPSGVADSIAKALASEGARMIGGDGKTIADVWLRKEIPLTVATGGYDAFAEGTLIGVLSFPEGGSDFRGQIIAAGSYTLRYEHIPQDGNHLGAAPEPNFLLLCPASEDRDLDATFTFETLVELSRHATKTNHPGPLMLQPLGSGPLPRVQRSDLGHFALAMKVSVKLHGAVDAKEFDLGLTLVGRTE